MIAQKNITSIVIGKDDNLATSSETRDDLIAGQIGIFKVGSAVANGASALSAGDRFQVVYKRNDGAIIESPVIEYSNITSKNAESTPAVETYRIRALGFNGTSGSIDATNSEYYVAHYEWDDGTKTFGRGKPTKFLAYTASSSATQVEIANGLAKNAIKNNQSEVSKVVIPTVLINNAGAAITGAPTSFDVVNGSKNVSWTGTDPTNLAVGDYIRLGGTAVTDPCYLITAVDATNNYITLDTAYQGATATILVASVEVIVEATAASADAGLVLTGQALPFEVGMKKYAQLDFWFWKIGEGFGSTTVSTTAAPSKGIGTYKEIAEVEWFLRGNRGESFRVADYIVNYTPDATSGKTYQQVLVDYKDLNATSIDSDVASFGSILIATENESASTVHTDLQTVFGI